MVVVALVVWLLGLEIVSNKGEDGEYEGCCGYGFDHWVLERWVLGWWVEEDGGEVGEGGRF